MSDLEPRLLRPAMLAGSNPGTFEVPSPDGKWLATEVGFDVAVRAGDGEMRVLTDDGTDDQRWVVDNARWSPDGARIAVARMDHRGVHRLPIVDTSGAVESVTWWPYTRTGGAMSQTELWVLDVETSERTRIDVPDDHDAFVLPLRWRAAGTELLVLVWDRCWRCVRLIACDVEPGTVRTVVEESSPTNVAGYGAVGGPLSIAHVSPSGELVASISEAADGWGHLWLRPVDGNGDAVRLTSGEFPVRAVASFDEDAGTLLFTANPHADRPYDTKLCSVGFDGKDFTVLRSLDAVREPAGAEFTALAADGTTELHGVLFTPPDFDPARSYPLVEVIYGGPQLVAHPRAHAPGTFAPIAESLAEEGFVTFIVDGRGTPERGKAFQDVGYGAFGQHVVDDHAGVVGQLGERHPFIDLDRVGITGPSWGGYMTTRAMLTAPGTYHVGVATCPVYDGEDHLAIAIEPYMGLPAENPDGYAAMSLFPLADRLRGKLLLIHGTADTNAPISTTMKMVDAFGRAGKHVDVLVLAGEHHHFEGPLGDYARRRRADYLIEHLRPEEG
jgi:dipeptidyl aminopeptidase/acylaminoacyl peptidase